MTPMRLLDHRNQPQNSAKTLRTNLEHLVFPDTLITACRLPA